MNLKALLRQVPTMYYVVGAGLTLLVSVFAWNNAHQRAIGALNAELKVVRAESDSAKKAFGVTLDTLRGRVADFEAKVVKVQAAKRSTDVVAGQLRSARDSLASAVADSVATIQQLRDRATRLIQASDSAEAAHQRERVASDLALAAAHRAAAFAVDSVRLSAQKAVEEALARAEIAERMAHVETGWRARLLQRCGVIGGYGGVIQRSGVSGGPAVILGCRVVP